MAKKEYFWLGVGVKVIDGKDYGAEMPLPVDKIDPADLKKMKKDGRIGEMITAIVTDDRDKVIAGLESQAKGTALRVVELETEIERLTKVNDNLQTDNEGKAALINDLKEAAKGGKK